MEDLNLNNDLTYDSYLEQEIPLSTFSLTGAVAITSINGIPGPTVTFAGGTSGFSFAPGGTTITLVSPLTAKGDLYTRTSTTGVALPVGANTFVLSADSGETTGLKWIANATGTVTSIAAGTGITLTPDPIVSTGTVALTVPVTAANGGTGQTSYAVGDLIYASATTTLSKLADVAVGSYLRSGGVTTAPLWSTTTLPNSATTGDLLYASASNVYSNLADVAAGSYLRSGGVTTAPLWSTATLPNTTTLGDVLYASAANVYSNLAKDTNATRYLSNTGTSNIPAWAQVNLTNGVSGVLPTANGGVDPNAWASWTPSLTNVTLGSGTVVAKYAQYGKLVVARFVFTFGSGSAVSGDFEFSLPVTSVSYGTANRPPLGPVTILDSGAAVYQGVVLWSSTTKVQCRVLNAAGATYVAQTSTSSTIPMTWATNDELNCEFYYESA